MKPNLFRYSELKNFIIKATEYGQVSSFENRSGLSGIILRHDVDFDLKPALRMAELERECGVSSTFFILTSAPTYNLNCSMSRKALRNLSDWGFEIGLHFDPTLYPDDDVEGLEERAFFETSIIEFVIGKRVKSLSLHNPSIHGQYPIFKSFLNAYAPEYFQAQNYMSDSRMSFRDKEPYEFIKRAATDRLQILLHPIHYSEEGESYLSLISECVFRFADTLHEYISLNSGYSEEMNGKTLREVLSGVAK
jgi:hypothetical protein